MQKAMLTLSSRSTLHLLDALGHGHDAPVFEWKNSLMPYLESVVDAEQVRLIFAETKNINCCLL